MGLNESEVSRLFDFNRWNWNGPQQDCCHFWFSLTFISEKTTKFLRINQFFLKICSSCSHNYTTSKQSVSQRPHFSLDTGLSTKLRARQKVGTTGVGLGRHRKTARDELAKQDQQRLTTDYKSKREGNRMTQVGTKVESSIFTRWTVTTTSHVRWEWYKTWF